ASSIASCKLNISVSVLLREADVWEVSVSVAPAHMPMAQNSNIKKVFLFIVLNLYSNSSALNLHSQFDAMNFYLKSDFSFLT
ncbi:MAG: hypothetical protein K2J78_07920, partial [Muribaculaceae bacterium]|nr:hypothetical protein [Muribaculaceae bacterium]